MGFSFAGLTPLREISGTVRHANGDQESHAKAPSPQSKLVSLRRSLASPMSSLTPEQMEQFARDGYLMVRDLFDAEEMDLLLNVAKSDQQLEREAKMRLDSASGRTK